MDRNVRVESEEGSGAEAAEAVQAGEHLVEDDGQASPIFGRGRRGAVGKACCKRGGEELWVFADDLDERALEERVAGSG